MTADQTFKIGDEVTCETGGSRTAKIVKVNKKTVVVELPSSDHIKRHIYKHNIQLVQSAAREAAGEHTIPTT